jgi:iron complex transport system substrate-binding protein
MRINEVTGIILNEAIRVHRELGPGLLESVYEAVLAKRLQQRGLSVDRQKPITITIDGEVYGEAFRIDLLVDGIVIVELKSVETLHPVHFKQVKTCLRPTNLQLGLLINFGEETLKQGYHRIVNNLRE